VQIPRPKPFLLLYNNEDVSRKKAKKMKKGRGADTYFLLPDFTSRILGIGPERVSTRKQALKKILAVKTGFELRRGLIIR
jgi:hypothetical protein